MRQVPPCGVRSDAAPAEILACADSGMVSVTAAVCWLAESFFDGAGRFICESGRSGSVRGPLLSETWVHPPCTPFVDEVVSGRAYAHGGTRMTIHLPGTPFVDVIDRPNPGTPFVDEVGCAAMAALQYDNLSSGHAIFC